MIGQRLLSAVTPCLSSFIFRSVLTSEIAKLICTTPLSGSLHWARCRRRPRFMRLSRSNSSPSLGSSTVLLPSSQRGHPQSSCVEFSRSSSTSAANARRLSPRAHVRLTSTFSCSARTSWIAHNSPSRTLPCTSAASCSSPFSRSRPTLATLSCRRAFATCAMLCRPDKQFANMPQAEPGSSPPARIFHGHAASNGCTNSRYNEECK
jgi:hypothetical protein